MNGLPGLLVASVFAMASAAALAKASGDQNVAFPPGSNKSNESATEDAFTPRFDGLRFIETLVTAHR
ncbi:hypothetical protein BT93_D2113 [Corymbia citriodora subsp. variegata]|nr:hypothetical protein BT93_D2113 [Corymbia citriodora subsp. variegata]